MFGALAGLVLGLAGHLGATMALRPLRVLREGQLAVSPHWLTLPCGARLDAAELTWAWRPVADDLWVLEAVGADGVHRPCCAGFEEELNGVAGYIDLLLAPAREDFQGAVDPGLAALRRQGQQQS